MFFKKNQKANKYGNKKVTFMGKEFDSLKEGKRYVYLKEQENLGHISDLRMQVHYELVPKQVETIPVQLKTKVKYVEHVVEHKAEYIADFVYTKDGNTIVEDVKGSDYTVTDKAKLQKKLMLWRYGIKVRYVFSPTESV